MKYPATEATYGNIPSGNLIAIEHGPFIVDLPIKKMVISIVMLAYQRVTYHIMYNGTNGNTFYPLVI